MYKSDKFTDDCGKSHTDISSGLEYLKNKLSFASDLMEKLKVISLEILRQLK